jgi:RNA polymerase sigma-B factor
LSRTETEYQAHDRPTGQGGHAERRRMKAVEAQLLRRYAETGDPAVKDELAQRLMPLARSMAMRYRSGSEPLDDLVQVASLGLVKAIEGFDPDRGRPFAAYAVPTMLGELRRHFRDHVWSVHLPRALQERTMEVRDAVETLGDRLGATPTVAQLAEHLEISEEEVLEGLEAGEARSAISLDAPRSVEEAQSAPMIETVPDDELGFESVESQLAAVRADLDERELRVLRMRFGRDMTQAEIGRELGVSQMQVSRIMRKGLRKLLEAVQDDEPDPARVDSLASAA